ncbi:MAG: hypothetical protein KDB86_08135 [Actinobacteria bacterium]|nr:hypothetical protein [Actinomycetota bacterium]
MAQTFVVAARVAVVAVLVVAALSKLLTPPKRSDPTILGLSPRVSTGVLVMCELSVAALLLIVPSVGSATAILLFVAMTMWLFTHLGSASGGCRCFGELSGAGIGWPQIARNAVLIGLAIVAGADGKDANGALAVLVGLPLGALMVLSDQLIPTGRPR